MKELIEEFLKQYADEVYDMPEAALDLIMDNHICVQWKNTEYFAPENNSNYTENDDLIYKFLDECYKL